MSDNYKLWCFVKGDEAPFPIIASSTILVEVLKIKIKEERSSLLEKVDACDLKLWKINVDLDTVKDKIMCDEYWPNADGQPLQSMEARISTISEVWCEPPPDGHLHVYVGHSPTIPLSAWQHPRNLPARTIRFEPSGVL